MRALVTGGQGFLGSRLARALRAEGHAVRVLIRRPAPEWAAQGIETMVGDLRDAAAVADACRDRDAVFHAAALVALWGPWKEFYDINVVGTEHVLAGCRRAGVTRLIYTSTPSVVFGNSDQRGVDETTPYPAHHLSPYAASKAEAERRVLAAHGRDGLRAVALRPHLVWGPGDPHIVRQLLARARRGRMFLVGDGRNRVDVTYIDNAVDAHLQADAALAKGSAGGRAFFISQGEPIAIGDFMRAVTAAAGLSPRFVKIPYPVAWLVGWAMEAWTSRKPAGIPLLTRFLAAELAKSHYYDIGAARRDLGYAPAVSTEEGLRRLAASLHGVKSGATPR